MNKPLTRGFQQASATDFFTDQSIDVQAAADSQRIQTGGRDRAAFLEMLFGSAEPFELPVAHLLDHRVRMPSAVAEAALESGAASVKRLLRRMLSMSRNPQAGYLVSKAIGRKPAVDAKLLCRLYTSYPEFAVLCLAGRLGDFSTDVAVPAGDGFVTPVAMMAVYYGALELQLISLRCWSIEQFRVGLDSGRETATMGQHASDIQALYECLEFLAKFVRTGQRRPGRTPELVRSLKPKADQELAAIRQRHPDLSDGDILEMTNELFTRSMKKRETEHEEFEAMRKVLANSGKGPEQKLRKRSSTVATDVEAGEQVAFAALRLLSLADGVAGAVQHPSTRQRTDGLMCFGPLPAMNMRAVGTLYLVSIRLLRRDETYGTLLDGNGAHVDISYPIKTAKRRGLLIGVETPKTVRETRKDWFARSTGSRGAALTGSSQWDMLPCFRFGASYRDDPGSFIRFRHR